MFGKQFVGKAFGEHVGYLRCGVDWFYDDGSLFYVFAKMVVLEGDMAGARANFGSICELQGASIIFEYGAGNIWNGKSKSEVMSEICHNVYQNNDIA